MVALAATGCGMVRSYQTDSTPRETNAAFVLDRNQPVLTSATMNGRAGRLILATANPRTIVGRWFATRTGARLEAGGGYRRTIQPLATEVGAPGDALIGFDAFARQRISIDYNKGLLSISPSRSRLPPDLRVHRFKDLPRVPVRVGGELFLAVVDSAFPDTLIVPSSVGAAGRRNAEVAVDGVGIGVIDVAHGPVSEARLGNRVLARFLVTVDYGRKWVALWPDPRWSLVVAGQTDLAVHPRVPDPAGSVATHDEVSSDILHRDASGTIRFHDDVSANRADIQ